MLYTLLFIVLATHCLAQPPVNPAPDVYWFTSKFDHFNDSDSRTFAQQYLVYDKFWTGDGPIFFCPGGEASVMGGYNHNGLMFELGKKVGAFLLFPEHRFYGDSLPFGPVNSYTRDNIKKLSVEQAMQDYVDIINFVRMKWRITAEAPIISYGGSYPGDLTVYMRVGFPDIIDAGLASSAPLLYHAGMVPGGGFFQVCTDDFSEYDARCPDMVRSAFNQLLVLMKSPAGRQTLAQKLSLCSVPGPNDARLLALWVENAFANLGMANYPWPANGMPKFPMQVSCSLMVQNFVTDPLVGLAAAVGVIYNSTGSNLVCNNVTDQYYPCADITGCGSPGPEAYSWDYQSCTELVSNVDTNNITDMFPPAPYDYGSLEEYCENTWGEMPRPLDLPTKYNYNNTTRLILSNGAEDPWYAGGVLPSICPSNQDMHCFFIDKGAHHLDLYGSDPVNDPPSVVQIRQMESSIITNWISQIRKEKAIKLQLKFN